MFWKFVLAVWSFCVTFGQFLKRKEPAARRVVKVAVCRLLWLVLTFVIALLHFARCLALPVAGLFFMFLFGARYTPAAARAMLSHIQAVGYALLSLLSLLAFQLVHTFVYGCIAAGHMERFVGTFRERVTRPLAALWRRVRPLCWVSEACDWLIALLRHWRDRLV